MGIPRWGWAQPGSCPGQQGQRCLGTGLMGPVVREVPVVGLESSGTSLTLPWAEILIPVSSWGSQGQDHLTQHPSVLISHGFRRVFSTPQNMLLATQTPANPPKTTNPCRGGSCQRQKLPSSSTVRSQEPELAVPPQNPSWDIIPGKRERGWECWEIPQLHIGYFIKSGAIPKPCGHLCLQPQRPEPLDAHQRGFGRGHSWQEPRGGLQELLREVFLQQTDLWA